MTASEARAGGFCSAKGRLLGTFVILHPEPQTWWFITHAGVAPALVKRLKMFVLRAKCTVTERTDLVVQGVEDATLMPWQVKTDGPGAEVPSSTVTAGEPSDRHGG